jgi:hypothetical protein
MTNQSKRRSRISAYVRSTVLSALGPASLTTVPTPARAQQAPCGDPRVCSCAPGITSSAGGAPRLSQPEPAAPDVFGRAGRGSAVLAPLLPDPTIKSQAQNRLQ